MSTAPEKKTKKVTMRKRRSDSPEENLRRIAALRKRQDEIGAQIKERQDELLKQLESSELDKLIFKDEEDGVTITGTVVRSETVSMDEEALKKKVGASTWKKITSLVLDKKKLDIAMSSGDVSLTDVAAVSTTTPRSPYIRITVK